MTKLRSLLAAALLLVAGSALAHPPCTPEVAPGRFCQNSAAQARTACGGSVYLTGAQTNSGYVTEHCERCTQNMSSSPLCSNGSLVGNPTTGTNVGANAGAVAAPQRPTEPK